MKKHYFQGDKNHPQHISVGAIVMNENGEVCCHHFLTKDLKGYMPDVGLEDFYILMRETIEPNETIEHALHRGLLEEFGITAELIDYIGTSLSHFMDGDVEVEKTTLYFLCKMISQDISKRSSDDIEKFSQVEWHDPEFLIPKMKIQSAKFKRTDIDESAILERVRKQLA